MDYNRNGLDWNVCMYNMRLCIVVQSPETNVGGLGDVG